MHSYLVVGKNQFLNEQEVKKLIKKLNVKALEFPLTKIEDVRNLSSFTSKSFSKKIAIVVKNIDQATTPSLNAFLKNLEEPQKNIIFILTAGSLHHLLATVVSRCQIIKVRGIDSFNKERRVVVDDFLKMQKVDKIIFVRTIKERSDAKKFLQELIVSFHLDLIASRNKGLELAKNLKITIHTLNCLEANTNLSLQLNNLAASLV